MFLSSVLRLSILGEPLLKPSQPSPYRLFLYEASLNLIFWIYLLCLILLACAGTFMMYRKRWNAGSNTLLYTIGFLLIFCSYDLQKITEIERLLNMSARITGPREKQRFWEGRFFPWNKKNGRKFPFEKGLSGLVDGYDSLPRFRVEQVSPGQINEVPSLRKSAPELRNVEDVVGIGNVNVVKRMGYNRNTVPVISKVEDSAYKMLGPRQNPTTEKKKVELIVKDNVKRNKPAASGEFSRGYNNALARDVDEREREETPFKNLLRLFEFKSATDEILKKHVLDLRETEKRVKADMDQFTEMFKKFMKEAEKIELEMLAFNAPTKYLNMVFNELRTEVKKYFNSLPEPKIHHEVPIYLSALMKNYNGANTGNINTDGIRPIIRYDNYMVLLFIIQVLCCLFLFIAVLVRLDVVIFTMRPIVSICLIATVMLNVVLLLTGQMLDRNCKAATVEGCNFNQILNRVDRATKSEMMTRINGLERELEMVIEETNRTTKILKKYIEDVIGENVNSKISVFSNLFNKITFVYEDFNHLTGNKVNKDEFYSYIRMMNKSLEGIATLLRLSEYRDMVDIYANELAFSFWLRADREIIIRSIKDIIEARPSAGIGMSRKWCVNALQSICDARDGTDYLFSLIFFGGPVFLFLLYL